MKIAYMHGAAIPSRAASTVQVVKMCDAFAAMGHTVLLLAPDKPDAEGGIEEIREFYGVKKPDLFLRATWPPIPGRTFICALHMARLALRFGAELVYSRFAAAAYAAAFAGIPVIHEIHRPCGQGARHEKILLRRLSKSRRLRSLVVISDALRRRVEQDLPDAAGRMIVAHDGADISDMERTPQSPPNARLQVGYVGSLYPGKGTEILLPLARQAPFADLHVIGGLDDEIATLRAKAAGIPNLSVHGFVPHGETRRLLGGFDVVLAPYGSRVGVYGDAAADISEFMSPLKLFEYMAAGKAIVCSDHPVLQEVVTHEKHVLICKRDEPGEWARALARLHADPELRARLGRQARELCAREYSWSVRARRVLAPASAH